MRDDLATGRHENPGQHRDYFTTAYLHRPDELAEEIAAAGFDLDGVYGVEGPGWMLPDFDARWNDARHRRHMLEAARAVERESGIVGASAHLLGIARRRRSDGERQ